MNRKLNINLSCRMVLMYGLFFFWSCAVYGQVDSKKNPSNLRALLAEVEKNYPSISAKMDEAEAAKTNIQLEKNTMLPSLDVSYQANYATYNNITGMNYPGQLMPISGPPSTENFNNPVPGTGAGILLNWAPLTFGQHAASVDYHQKIFERQKAAVEDELLRIQFNTAKYYLEIVATREMIKAYQKNIEKNEFNLVQINTLVNSGLSPGVDSLKFRGELSRSTISLLRSQNILESQLQHLQELVVAKELPDFATDSTFFKSLPHLPENQSESDSVINPVLKMARFGLEAEEARLKQINRSWVPRLEIWGTAYARGSGIRYDGMVDKNDGWSLTRYNYGAGLQLVLPIIDLADLKLKNNRQEFITHSTESYLHQTEITLTSQENIARYELITALKIAGEAPLEYQANESAFNALQRRYNEGLTDYAGLMQAQYDLLRAESGLRKAYLDAWQALLKLAVVKGDIHIFLSQIPN